jgi:ABC-2 type transport system ATP-binding protein
MRGGQIIASGRPEDLGGRDLRPAEVRFELPEGVGIGDVPEVPAEDRSLQGDRVIIQTRQPVRAAQIVTSWAVEGGVELAHFSVTQPTLEDIYLELTGADDHHAQAEEARR